MRELRAQSMSAAFIARILNDERLKPPRGDRWVRTTVDNLAVIAVPTTTSMWKTAKALAPSVARKWTRDPLASS